MSESIRRIRQNGVAYYLNKVSKGGCSGGVRFALYRTSEGGRTRDGFVYTNSTEGHALAAVVGDQAFFEACEACFASKPARKFEPRKEIRGPAGRWEGEAFKSRRHVRVVAR